ASNGDSRAGRAGRASPAVRRLAEEHNIDIGAIRGSGSGGRVSKKDVEDYLASGKAVPSVPPVQPSPAAAAPVPGPAAGDQLIPLNAMRKAIAEHMVRSRRTSPHAWCAVEVDMTNVVALRRAEREAFRATDGVDLSYVPFVIKAACESLRAHPGVNASFTDEGILRHAAINISIAVALDDGLILPVIHDADRLSITGLAHQLSDLAERARAGKLTLPDVARGTFCVNNPGTFGTVLSAPIINQPQAAIMTMEAIVKRPVVMPGDLIGIRSMMYAAMSFDHRVLDGLEAASFLGDVKKSLEAMAPGMPLR
ncbi:MAG: dihydrolipoamide acetyltransferase family protein, partial [Candidatus Dormiibacterota bacterium]